MTSRPTEALAALAPLARRTAAFDAAVDELVERWRRPALDHVFYPLSSAADHGLLWLAAGSLRAARRHEGREVVRLVAVLGAESFLTNVVVKSWFRRVRPDRAPAGELRYGLHVPITSSFPSGHATAAFTAAAVLGDDPRRRTTWYALAVLVAASRVYVRLHHASDVVAGAALGAVLGAALPRLARRLVP